jgi:small nuclear ribonucleoprotein (snRNP)-like protein
MNLILSDVEETIMLVDGTESASPGQGVVNVSPLHLPPLQPFPYVTSQVAKRKMEMLFVRGDGVILVRISFSVCVSVSVPFSILGIASFTVVTFIYRPMTLDVVRFCMLLAQRDLKHNMHIIAGSSYESWVTNFVLLKSSPQTKFTIGRHHQSSVQGLPGISIIIHTCVPVDDAYNNTVYRPPYT